MAICHITVTLLDPPTSLLRMSKRSKCFSRFCVQWQCCLGGGLDVCRQEPWDPQHGPEQGSSFIICKEFLGESFSLKILAMDQAKVQGPPLFTMIIMKDQTKVLSRLSLAAKISLQWRSFQFCTISCSRSSGAIKDISQQREKSYHKYW